LICRVEDMRDKEVISISDGTKVGWVCDAEIDTVTASLTAIVIFGRLRLFGLLGREEDIVIPWQNVSLIGDDTILVDYVPKQNSKKRKSLFSGLIEIK
jgi:YlmC/YmxH family sporulation protein